MLDRAPGQIPNVFAGKNHELSYENNSLYRRVYTVPTSGHQPGAATGNRRPRAE
jgi:hypothetical protein